MLLAITTSVIDLLKKATASFSLIGGLCLLSVLLFTASPASAQLQIAPTAIFMDEDNQTERVVVRNSASEPVVVEVEMLYGYPDTDEKGNVYLRRFESIPADEPSAKDWVRVYPRFFELPPGEQQTIRFAARPPSDLEQGEYWARPAIVAHLPGHHIASTDEDITAKLNMRRRTILSLNYRNGEVHTGINIDNLAAEFTEEDTISVTADLERTGNAAYLGHYRLDLMNSSGYPAHSTRRKIAVYRDQNRSFHIDASEIPAGSYTIELELFTDRRRGEEEDIISASTVVNTTRVEVP